MKWENRDVKVRKQANTTKFNKVDNIWTTPSFLMIVGYTKL